HILAVAAASLGNLGVGGQRGARPGTASILCLWHICHRDWHHLQRHRRTLIWPARRYGGTDGGPLYDERHGPQLGGIAARAEYSHDSLLVDAAERKPGDDALVLAAIGAVRNDDFPQRVARRNAGCGAHTPDAPVDRDSAAVEAEGSGGNSKRRHRRMRSVSCSEQDLAANLSDWQGSYRGHHDAPHANLGGQRGCISRSSFRGSRS